MNYEHAHTRIVFIDNNDRLRRVIENSGDILS